MQIGSFIRACVGVRLGGLQVKACIKQTKDNYACLSMRFELTIITYRITKTIFDRDRNLTTGGILEVMGSLLEYILHMRTLELVWLIHRKFQRRL